MDLNKIQFFISNKAVLSKEEKEILLKAYRELFIKIYGHDIIGAFLKEDEKKRKKLKTFSNSYVNSIDVLNSVLENDNYSLLLIYYENKLLGAGRINKINEEEASIPDIAISNTLEEEKREIWKLAILFVEDYFKKIGIKKMYLEVPVKEPTLLFRADDLGFREDPADVDIFEKPKTYLLNKKLVRCKDEKFNSSN